MKFITQCVEEEKREDDFKAFPDDGKFVELMKQQRLTENLIHYILYSMCMGSSEMTFKEGLERLKIYLTSIGRYGNTPFLFPMFGCGEIPQCFCRLCAVFGGVYWLGQPINEISVTENENPEVKIKFGDEEITAKKLVCGMSRSKELPPHEFMSRAVIITTSPVGGSSVNSEVDGGGAVLLYHPIEGRSDGVTMIQLSHYTNCIAKGLCKFWEINFPFLKLTPI
jgi:Rab proteins geranylgeranyltransferase component A